MNDAMRAVQVRRHDTRRQTVVGIVSAANDFVFRLVGQNGHHRPENLFAHDGHFVAAIGEHGRCNPCAVIEAIAFQYIAAAQYARAFLFAFGDIAQHVIAMREADQRAEVSLRIENVARANALNARQNLLFKCGFAFRRNEDASAVGTHRTGAEEIRHHGDIGGEIEIRIVKNDQR